MNLNLPESPVCWVKEQCHFVQGPGAMDEAPWAIWEAEKRAQRPGASFLLRRSHCRVQCLSNRPRVWHRTNYTPIYLEGVDMTPWPKAKLETLKSRMTEKHNLDFSPAMVNHKYRQSPLWPVSLSGPTALPWGRDLYVLSCLGAFEMRVHDSPTA